MKRKEIKQITNLNWFPFFLKKLITEFLSWFVLKVNASKPFIPVITKILTTTKTKKIINVEFNNGAGIETVTPFLEKDIEVLSINYNNFNTNKNGLYLFVNCFHQFSPDKAKRNLKRICESGNPIVIVEGNNDSLWQIVGMTIFVPLSVLLSAPFVKPFRISRILFTYIIPILPIVIMIDGCIALLKLYNPADLTEITSSLQNYNYKWKSGKSDNGRGGKIMFLTGKK
ncbi:MAG: hypothetical protein ACPGSL_02165 [Vicingaceae bacterium]